MADTLAPTLRRMADMNASSVAERLGMRRWRMLALAAVLLCVSLVFAWLVLAIDLAAISTLAVLVGIVAITARPRYGLYVVYAMVIFFEPTSQDPFMAPGIYLNRSVQDTLRLNGAILIPFEMLLLFTSAVWLAVGWMRHQIDYRPGSLGRPVLLFCLAVAWGCLRGFAASAVFNFVFWESRFLFAMVLAYVLAANTIRRPAHVRMLLLITFVATSLSGIEGVYRQLVLADTGALGSVKETWYSHDDVVFWGLQFLMVLAQQVFGGPRWQRILGPLLMIPVGFTMLASERRAGYIAVEVAFLAFAIFLLKVKRKAFFLVCVPVLVAGAVYLPLFWNNTSMLGQPARAIRSLKDPDPRDASSNLSRDLEAINVRATIASDPLMGIGFGRPFLQVVQIPDISFFPFWNYEAHHDVLWVWMKVGGVGFILFWALMGGGISRAVYLAKIMRYPDARVFALVTLSGITMSLVFCYVDLGLTVSRVPVLLGTMLGTLSVLEEIYA